MDDAAAIRVRISVKRPAAERIAAYLQGDSRVTIVDDETAEVVVVDAESPRSVSSEIGIIAIDNGVEADVVLHEPTASELRLACRLLGDNVQLRRRLRTLDEQRTDLTRQAQTDPLTGVANRRAWDEELAARCGAAAAGRLLCLAIADLDHFKAVNDRHGLAAGDAVLRVAAQALAGSIRSADFVARLGGDEFGLLLWDLDATSAAAALERVRAAVPKSLADVGLPTVTASIGFVLNSDRTAGSAAIFAKADAALREAKRQGRDRIAKG